MGGTLDPQSLMNFLNAAGGDSSGYKPENDLSGLQPPPQSQQQAQQNAPPQNAPPSVSAPVQASAQPQRSQIHGIKGYLANIFYNMGEAAKANLGMPTDAEMNIKQQQLNIQQQEANARVLTQQAEADFRKQMTAQNALMPITDPNEAKALGLQLGDMVSPQQKFALYKQALQNQGRIQATVGAAQVRALAQMSQVSMKAAYMPDGSLGVGLYDKAGNFRGYADNAIVPAEYLEKIKQGQTFKVDADGTLHTIPTTNISAPVIPPNPNQIRDRGPLPGPGSPPPNINASNAISTLRKGAGVGGGTVFKTPKMVVGTDSQGNQVAGTPSEMKQAGVAQFTDLGAAEAAKVNTARQMTSPNGLFGLIDKDLAQFRPGELEALGPRWNEFLAGTVGTADPRYVALRTHVNGLLSTALMQAHVGARGGERLMEHFEDIANAGKMSLPTLKAAIGAERQYVEEKAMRPNIPSSISAIQNAATVTYSANGKTYTIPRDREAEFLKDNPGAQRQNAR